MEQVSQVTPAEAVEAALAALEDHVDAKECCARAALEAAAPHMLAGIEWAIFRASDGPDGTPMENMRYKSREAAQRWIDAGFSQPEFWEVRGRAVGEWAK